MRRSPLARRSVIRSKRPRKTWRRPDDDKVTPEDREEVLRRDGPCVAPLFGETGCRGRTTMAHVKRAPRMGKRAESSVYRMVAACEGHVEAGMIAGAVWITRADVIAKLRRYLAEMEALDELEELDGGEGQPRIG